MNLTEKISYIRGLCDGLELDESKPEVKVLNAIVDLLDDMAFEVSDMEELYDELSAQVDEIDQDLADVESDVTMTRTMTLKIMTMKMTITILMMKRILFMR